jgi:hypothetical protein
MGNRQKPATCLRGQPQTRCRGYPASTGTGQSIFNQTFKVKLDGLTNVPDALFDGLALCVAAGQDRAKDVVAAFNGISTSSSFSKMAVTRCAINTSPPSILGDAEFPLSKLYGPLILKMPPCSVLRAQLFATHYRYPRNPLFN